MAKNLVLLVFSALLVPVSAECVFRLQYSEPWYETLLDEQVWSKPTCELNQLGLRDRDYPASKPANSTRVLILGDSFTKGSGVEDSSAVFPEIIERRLQAAYSTSGGTVEILNGGIGGSLTHQWVDLLLEVAESFQPDVILIVFFLRDGTLIRSQASFFEPIKFELEQRQESRLYEHVYSYRWYRDQRHRRYISERYSQRLINAYFGDATQTQEWARAQSNLLKIRAIADEIDAEVGLAVFPVLAELNDEYPFRNVCDTIVEFGKANRISTHDLLPAFMGMHAPDLWVSPMDQHPNERAHRIAADSLEPFLESLMNRERGMRMTRMSSDGMKTRVNGNGS